MKRSGVCGQHARDLDGEYRALEARRGGPEINGMTTGKLFQISVARTRRAQLFWVFDNRLKAMDGDLIHFLRLSRLPPESHYLPNYGKRNSG